MTKSSGHSCFPPNFCLCCFKFSFFFIGFQCSSFLNMEWAKYMASAVLHTVFLTNSNYLQGWSLLFPDIFHPLKCFFVFLPFGILPQCTTSVRTIRECDNEHSRMQMKWCLKPGGCWWLVLNLMSVSKWQLWNWLKPFSVRRFQKIFFICIGREAM